MIRLLFLLLFGFTVYGVDAQNSLQLRVRSAGEKQPLPGATVTMRLPGRTFVSDSAGIVIIPGLPSGKHRLHISFVGFRDETLELLLPLTDDLPVEIYLEEEEEHEEEVIVSATRISRTIANIPTRVEVISGEELAEKGNMRPGEIRMLLGESTGIQVQQTSATSFNAGIRIQGLDGRYTQILRDGYPLYSGFAGGLSIMQIAPLDLRQVEVIKGSASTLYGGGAIAGLVDLVSKTPGTSRELSFIANGTSAGGLDLSGFYSEKYGSAGVTVFASSNSNRPFDPADIGLTAIPMFRRYNLHPRVFIYGKKTNANAGISYITEERTGGSINYIKNGGNGFYEKNNTDRLTTQLGITHQLGEQSSLQFKNSYSRFDRKITTPNNGFDALQQSSFSEITWNLTRAAADWVIGGNFLTDDLKEAGSLPLKRDFNYQTYGLFIQNAWTISTKWVLETGLRGDYVPEYGFQLLPRVSTMVRITPKITTRLGGGFGYKTPTIFTEEAERIQFQNLLPIDELRTQYERSIGGNWDVHFSTRLKDFGIVANHLFFYTRLNDPLILTSAGGGQLRFQNDNGYLDTKGMETNLRLVYGHFKLFVGYTFTDAHTHFSSGRARLPLTAKHRLNNVLMFEIEDQLKLGLEAYYFGSQKLNDGTTGKSYWITGFMAEKIWEHLSVFINFENFTGTRQTKFDTIYTGTIDNPVFRDIYAPLEGFIVNGGIKIRL